MTKRFLIIVLLPLILNFTGCGLFAQNGVPYGIGAQMKTESSSEYSMAGLDVHFVNKSEKTVKSFTLVFFLFDEDGESPYGVRNNIVMTINSDIEGKEELENCFSLDNFFYVEPEYAYEVDYLYVSQIVYADGTEWKDPLGLAAFY